MQVGSGTRFTFLQEARLGGTRKLLAVLSYRACFAALLHGTGLGRPRESLSVFADRFGNARRAFLSDDRGSNKQA